MVTLLLASIPSCFPKSQPRFVAVDFPIHAHQRKALPINPNDATEMASEDDSATWSDFDRAVACRQPRSEVVVGAVVGENLVITMADCLRQGRLDVRAKALIGMIGAEWSVAWNGRDVHLYVADAGHLIPATVARRLSWTEIEFTTGAVFTFLAGTVHPAAKSPDEQSAAALGWFHRYAGDGDRAGVWNAMLDDDFLWPGPADHAPPPPPLKQRPHPQPQGPHEREHLLVDPQFLAQELATSGENYRLLHFLQIKHVQELHGSGGLIWNASMHYADVARKPMRTARHRLVKLAQSGFGTYDVVNDAFRPLGWKVALRRYGLAPRRRVAVTAELLYRDATLKQLSYDIDRRSAGTRVVESRNELKRITRAGANTQRTVERRHTFDVQYNAIKVVNHEGTPLPGFTLRQTPRGTTLVDHAAIVKVPRPVLKGEHGWYAQIPNSIANPGFDPNAPLADTTRTPNRSSSGFAQQSVQCRYFDGDRPNSGIWKTGMVDFASGVLINVFEVVG